ncbi:hypothetical protein ACHAXS_013922 [Conticribra weissflogii]
MDLRRIISWMPHGRSWKIIDLPEFERKVLPQYFKQSNMKSFHRQANGWGFRRMLKGPDKGSFYNEFFIRGVPHLCKKMKRIGGAKTIEDANISHEPNLWMISTIHPLPETIRRDDLNFIVLKTINECVERDGPKAQMPFVHELQSAGVKSASNHTASDPAAAATSSALPVLSTRAAGSKARSLSSSSSPSSAVAKSTSSDSSLEKTNSDNYCSSKPSPVNAEVRAHCAGHSSSGFPGENLANTNTEAFIQLLAQNAITQNPHQSSAVAVGGRGNSRDFSLAPSNQTAFSGQVNQPRNNLNQVQQFQNYLQQLQQQQQPPLPSSSIEEMLGLILSGSIPITTAPENGGVGLPQGNRIFNPYRCTSTMRPPQALAPDAPTSTNIFQQPAMLNQDHRINRNLERMLLSLLKTQNASQNQESILSRTIPANQQWTHSNSTVYSQSNLLPRSSNLQQPITQNQNINTAFKNQVEAAIKAQLQSSHKTQGTTGVMQEQPHRAPQLQIRHLQQSQRSQSSNNSFSNHISEDALNDMLSQSIVAGILLGFGNNNSGNNENRRQGQNQQGNSRGTIPHGNSSYG